MNIVEQIQQELAGFNQKRKELAAELQKKFPALFAPLFEQFPEVTTVKWRQYTPYFNDGDECVFGIQNDYDSLEINNVDYWDKQDADSEEPYKAFADILQSVPEEFYKDLFGDHVEVTIHKDLTITTEEYQHD